MHARPQLSEEDHISNTLHDHDLSTFLENAENEGTIDVVAMEELAVELDLGDDELAVVRAELDARGVEISDRAGRRPRTTSSSWTSSRKRPRASTR